MCPTHVCVKACKEQSKDTKEQGWPAGGAEEEVVQSAQRFVVELTLSGGGALRSSVVESPPSSSSRIFGSVELLNPSLASEWRSGRILLKKEEVVFCLAVKMVDQGVGSQEPATGDFPSVEGLCLIQAIKGCSGGGAPPAEVVAIDIGV